MGKTIQNYLSGKGYNMPPDETFSHIQEWLEWYQGDVRKFHRYKVYNGVNMTVHRRHSLNMAKKVSEDWANLLLNEKVSIKVGDFTKQLEEIFADNNFYVRGNQLIEITFALGTGAFVEYLDGAGDVVIDYLRADMIYPLSWDNGDVIECAFGTTKVIDGKEIIYLQIHRLGDEKDGENPATYYIENVYVDAESGKEVNIPEEIEVLVETRSEKPLFQIITPNFYNNIDLDSPFGISVYANAIEQLKGCDIIYDSYINEFVLGRKRVIVPISMARIQMEKDGVNAPKFDPEDSVFYAMPDDRQGSLGLTEVDMSIRAQEHELGIQRNLDVLSLVVGMGTGRYQFESSGVKTATEVISDRTDLYQNRQKNSTIIKQAVVNLVEAVAFLAGKSVTEVSVDFDDSIIEDVNTTVDRNIKLVQAGLRSKLTAIMEINKINESEAQKELKRIAEDGQITGQDIDWTGSDDEDDTGVPGDNPEDEGLEENPDYFDEESSEDGEKAKESNEDVEDEDNEKVNKQERRRKKGKVNESSGKSKAGRTSRSKLH